MKITRLKKSVFCIVFSGLLCTSFAGCGEKGGESPSSGIAGSSVSSSASSAGTSSEEPLPDGQLTAEPVTFTYWVSLDNNAAASISSYGENKMYQELEKITNVHIDFLHPTIGQEKEQFNLMIASRDLPDFIEYGWTSYDGGPEKAISDGIIIQLNDLLDQYAPDAKALMQSSDVVSK